VDTHPPYATIEETAPVFDHIQIPKDFATATDADLNSLETQVREAAAPLIPRAQGEGDPLTPDEAAGLHRLSEVVSSVRTERERRIGEASATAASTRKTTEALAVFATDAPADDVGDEDEGEKTEDAEDGKKGQDAVTASGGKKAPRIAEVAGAGNGKAPAAPGAQADEVQRFSRMVAPANVPTINAGTEYKNISEVAKAAEAAFSAFPTTRGAGAGQYIRTPVMMLQREFPPELRLTDRANADEVERVFAHAGDESRLEGGLVAAAGWCAPSQIDYALFELEGTAGMFDMPEVQISRGGIQFTTGPDFSTIFGGSGYWHQTEAQVQAATTKPCMVISCPSFTEKRLEVEGVCITGAFLQDRGYPEMVARFTRGALKAHARKLNIFKINQVVAGSTLFDYTNVANLPVTTTEFKDLSVVNRLLGILDIQAIDYRYKYRMDPEATLEAVLPYWLIASIRADVSRRMGISPDEAETVTMAMFNSWASQRGVRLQWIYDWQDTYNTTNTSIVGQTAGIYTMPTTVEVLLYAPGTWVAGVSDVVRLDTVYDSTNLALNQYTQLFTEEGILVAKRGFESRRIKTTIDPSGTTSATTDMRTG
jgi:hypothetical protein